MRTGKDGGAGTALIPDKEAGRGAEVLLVDPGVEILEAYDFS